MLMPMKIPSVPITFDIPADFTSRAAGSTEAGCLWGIKDDLDHATANPAEADFSSLTRGIFRVRMSTNVVCDPQTGTFDKYARYLSKGGSS